MCRHDRRLSHSRTRNDGENNASRYFHILCRIQRKLHTESMCGCTCVFKRGPRIFCLTGDQESNKPNTTKRDSAPNYWSATGTRARECGIGNRARALTLCSVKFPMRNLLSYATRKFACAAAARTANFSCRPTGDILN